MGLPELDLANFAAFALILLRVSSMLFLAPIFGSELVPAQVKIGLAFLITLILTAVVKVKTLILPETLFGFGVLVAGEVFVGLAIGLTIRMMLEAVQLAAQYLGVEMGFSMVTVIDPQSGEQSSVLSQFAYILALLIFLMANGHHIIVNALARSFELVPVGGPALNSLVFDEVMRRFAELFVLAIQIGAPALAVLFFAQVSMGIVAKAVPQMNILFVGMPLYIIVGMFIFGLSLNVMSALLIRAVGVMEISVFNLLKAM